jgi:predicted flap endonuclease-1-like 5' DNA nuclease
MKRVIRWLAILGGIGAVMWAMRDRLISIPATREPAHPQFRPAPAPVPLPVSADDLTRIHGIGPVFAARLNAAGITTFAQLSGASASTVAGAAGVPESRAADWISQARGL